MKSSHRSKNLREAQARQILNTPFWPFSQRQWCSQSKCPYFYWWGKAEYSVCIHISCMEAELWRLPRASLLHLPLGSICHLSYILAVQSWSYYLNLISSFFKNSLIIQGCFQKMYLEDLAPNLAWFGTLWFPWLSAVGTICESTLWVTSRR